MMYKREDCIGYFAVNSLYYKTPQLQYRGSLQPLSQSYHKISRDKLLEKKKGLVVIYEVVYLKRFSKTDFQFCGIVALKGYRGGSDCKPASCTSPWFLGLSTAALQRRVYRHPATFAVSSWRHASCFSGVLTWGALDDSKRSL